MDRNNCASNGLVGIGSDGVCVNSNNADTSCWSVLAIFIVIMLIAFIIDKFDNKDRNA